MVKILVTFAVAQELAPWRALRQFRRQELLGVSVQAARVGDVEVHAIVTGMGGQHAARCARMAMANEYDACICAGLAGGLKPVHPTGRVLVARTVRTGVGDEFLTTDGRLRRLAAICGARVVDAFYSAERILVTAREKAALALLADAVEMEGFAVLEEARKWNVPAVAIRVISDDATQDLPLDFNRAMTRAGRVSLPRLLGQLARRPRATKDLIRLGKETRRVTAKLAAYLDSYMEALAGLSHQESSLTQKVTG
jgi:nucleoside phosphorylase